jgi:hypothetical protein
LLAAIFNITDVAHDGDKKASSTKSPKGTNRVKPHGSHALMRIVIDSFTAVPDLRLGEQSSTRQTFQVLRLPWMAAETAPGSLRHFLHPWRSEVLEPPGAAPVKTWKV